MYKTKEIELLTACLFFFSEHAGNAAMLHSLGITHVVSVGESLMNMDNSINTYYGHNSQNTLAAAVRAGKLSV